jgi:LPS-assembly lipoprotein
MSSFRLLPACLLLAAAAAAGCTVQPLYSKPEASAYAPGGGLQALNSIGIKPVDTRAAQEVRNHLIFAFNGGAGQPASPRYEMTLKVASIKDDGLVTQVADENMPSAGTVTLIAEYVVSDAATARPIASGRRQITANYDIPRQEFANVRAERDAENRAARELAELLKLAVAQDLRRAG